MRDANRIEYEPVRSDFHSVLANIGSVIKIKIGFVKNNNNDQKPPILASA